MMASIVKIDRHNYITDLDSQRGYVTFTLGGNAFEGAELRNYVSIMAGSNEVARVHNDAFSDPHRSLNMVLKVVNVPDVYIDQDLHLVIVDGKTMWLWRCYIWSFKG